MKDLVQNVVKAIVVITLIASFLFFLYGVTQYFGQQKVILINSYNTPWTKNADPLPPLVKEVQDTINSSFNQQKDVFSLLITVTSLGIFIITLLTAMNISEKTKSIDQYFDQLQKAPERLIRVFYDEILKKIRQQLRSRSKDLDLLENLRFLSSAPTIYKDDFELFSECYDYFHRKIRSVRGYGISFSAKLMLQSDQGRALEKITADIGSGHRDHVYMDAVIPVVGGLLPKNFVFEKLVNTNYLQGPLTSLFWNHELLESDFLSIIDNSSGQFVAINVNTVAYLARDKKVIVDRLLEKKIPIPTTIFNDLKLYSDDDLKFVDAVLVAADWPEWLKEQLAQELVENNYSIGKPLDPNAINNVKSPELKKWMGTKR